MLKQRIITALVLLPFGLGAWEWARLAGFTAQVQRVAYAALVAALLFGLYLLPALVPWVLLLGVVWWGVATFLVLGYPASSRYWTQAPVRLLIGLLILLPAWQGLMLIG